MPSDEQTKTIPVPCGGLQDAFDGLYDEVSSTLQSRLEDYGDSRSTHESIAAMWTVILGHPVTARDVALCMAAMKLVRYTRTPAHRDSIVDLVGYAAIAAFLSARK